LVITVGVLALGPAIRSGVCAATGAEPAAAVRLVKQAEAVQVFVGEQLFTEYRIAASLPKPYFYPVLSASGKPMTRQMPISTGEDHPHQKSVWLAIDEVNEVDFWAEKGKIVNRSVEIVEAVGDPAVFRARNEWQDATGKAVVTETTTVRVFANRLMAFQFTFSAGDEPVTFGDTKEGLFGVRMNTQLREDKGTGRITNADGLATEKNCWSKESAWVDYSGKVDDSAVGVAMLDHPKNFRRSRWHVRGYGLFSVNPFGGKAYTRDPKNDGTHRLDAKQSLTLRYGLYVHDGDAKQARVADVYAQYAAGE
jgi:hypothetical protein